MKKTLFLACCLTAIAISAMAQQHQHQHYYDVNKTPNARVKEFRKNQVIVKFKDESGVSVTRAGNTGVNSVNEILKKYTFDEAEQLMPLTGKLTMTRSVKTYDGKEIELRDLSRLYCFRSEKDIDVNAVVEELKALPEVELAEPNYLVYTCAASDDWKADPLYSQQWGIPAVNADKLWDKPVINDKRPVIAILDTGVDISHPDLADNIWTNQSEAAGSDGYDDDDNGFKDDVHGWDFVNQTGVIDDYNGHGTHCAGIAAAVGGNGIGVVGANPEALIMPVTVMQSDGTGDIATIVKGIDYAVANGADVISMSFGGYAYSLVEEQALARAYAKAVLVAAAGNNSYYICPHQGLPFGQMFPAAFTFVFGVQAANANGDLEGYSNIDTDGPVYYCPICFTKEQMYNYELKAPGSNIWSTYPKGRYKALTGTSMSCPLVAGAVSRLLQTKNYDSKELLFGDLIHSSKGNVDFLATYNITDADRKPEVWILSWRIDDEKDHDGRFDAGEIINLYPTVMNQWGQAENIKVWLDKGELEKDIIELLETRASFDKPLSGYGKAETANPFRFRMADDVTDGRHCRLVLYAQCDGMAEPYSQEVVIIAENGVEIGGLITEDLTLEPGVSYIVTKTLSVPNGVKLTIKPGTVIKFSDGCNIQCESSDNIVAIGEPDNMIEFTSRDNFYQNKVSIDIKNIKNAKFYNLALMIANHSSPNPSVAENCLVTDCYFFSGSKMPWFIKSNVTNNLNKWELGNGENTNFISNIGIDCPYYFYSEGVTNYKNNNFYGYRSDGVDLENIYYMRGAGWGKIMFDYPSYWGSSDRSTVKNHIDDDDNIRSGGQNYVFDMSNMLTQPNPNAHGVLWKVCVNGYDAQDEFKQLPPLGVGQHKFEIWYSKKIDESEKPFIAMGVRAPYTQTEIAEDGSWRTETTHYVVKNSEGTITEERDVEHSVYTAYLTIKGSMAIDGLNRIYVSGCKDLDYFEIPLEDTRFNVEVAAAGSMSTGFFGEAGVGKVTLTWVGQDDNVEDIIGYNMYRYTERPGTNEDGYYDNNWNWIIPETVRDTIKINQRLLDETVFVDYDVVPGTTYNYYYKIMRTDLAETSPSRVVAVTPVTASKGDANGSMTVDVADVVTEINYLTGQNPQPFIFEAADVNSDEKINILDVVGTINIIVNPASAGITALGEAEYTIEDGTLYVETPVAIGGVQVQIRAMVDQKFQTLEALNGFEQASSWTSETDYMFLAYSLSGKTLAPGRHAIMKIGNAELDGIVLSDARGMIVNVKCSDATAISEVAAENDILGQPFPNPICDVVTIPYEIAGNGKHNVRFEIYDVLGRIQQVWNGVADGGKHSYTWNANGQATGVYFAVLKVDGKQIGTVKLIKE